MNTARPLATTRTETPSRALNITLWIAQIFLLSFLVGGAMKAFAPVEAQVARAAWAGEIPVALLRFIGIAEILGALGVILPAATRIKPWLTPLAAAGLATIMILAAIFHYARGEMDMIPANIVLGALALFVAWGRFRKAPIPPRG